MLCACAGRFLANWLPDTAGDPTTDRYQSKREHTFSFGLWAVGNPCRDPFGEPVRAILPPLELVRLLAAVGATAKRGRDLTSRESLIATQR